MLLAENIDLTSFVGQLVDAATWASLLATSAHRHGPTWAWQATRLANGDQLVTGVHVLHALPGQKPESEKITVPELAV